MSAGRMGFLEVCAPQLRILIRLGPRANDHGCAYTSVSYSLRRCSALDGPFLVAPLLSRMTPRRSRYGPRDESHASHWLVTYDPHRTVLASKCLPIGTDLSSALGQAIAEYQSDGWTIENDGAYGFFFCNRDGERREIRLQSTNPSQPVPLDNTSANRCLHKS